MREDEEWLYYGCENMKSLAVFVRARRHLEILFLNFQFLKIKKKGGNGWGNLEFPTWLIFIGQEIEAPVDNPRRTEGDE